MWSLLSVVILAPFVKYVVMRHHQQRTMRHQECCGLWQLLTTDSSGYELLPSFNHTISKPLVPELIYPLKKDEINGKKE